MRRGWVSNSSALLRRHRLCRLALPGTCPRAAAHLPCWRLQCGTCKLPGARNFITPAQPTIMTLFCLSLSIPGALPACFDHNSGRECGFFGLNGPIWAPYGQPNKSLVFIVCWGTALSQASSSMLTLEWSPAQWRRVLTAATQRRPVSVLGCTCQTGLMGLLRACVFEFECKFMVQGDIVELDVNSRQNGGPTVVTADDCCNECRKNSKASHCPCTLALTPCLAAI